MNCIHCDEPNPHPGTRKCTDIQACDGRQDYARGVADERARVVADLRTWARSLPGQFDEMAKTLESVANRYERGEHESEGT